jgi:hypothetical protein
MVESVLVWYDRPSEQQLAKFMYSIRGAVMAAGKDHLPAQVMVPCAVASYEHKLNRCMKVYDHRARGPDGRAHAFHAEAPLRDDELYRSPQLYQTCCTIQLKGGYLSSTVSMPVKLRCLKYEEVSGKVAPQCIQLVHVRARPSCS